MKAAELLQTIISEMNMVLLSDVKDLTPEHLAWKPAPGANPIGFIFWHLVRIEDEFVSDLLEKPSIWESEKWDAKLGMDTKAHGMGFQEPEVDKVAALPLAEIMGYAKLVIQTVDDYLKSLDDDKLDVAPNPEKPKRTIAMILRNFILAHGWWHIGEIKYLKGMQGMPAPR
jgi:hypothetical protein